MALLSREGEMRSPSVLKRARKISQPSSTDLPMTLEFVLNLRDQLKNGKIDVREIVPVVETEEDFEEEAVEKDYEELRSRPWIPFERGS